MFLNVCQKYRKSENDPISARLVSQALTNVNIFAVTLVEQRAADELAWMTKA